MPFSAINKVSISVNNANFTFLFFKVSCHVNHGAEIKLARSSSYISRHIFQNFSNTLATNNALL